MIKMILATTFHTLTHHLWRTLLTVLGIIIGIAGMITIMSIGYGTQMRIKEQLIAMGDNYIYIHGQNTKTPVAKKLFLKKPMRLTTDDIQALQTTCSSLIKRISPFIVTSQPVGAHGKLINSPVKAGNEHLLHIMGRSIASGSPITHDHVRSKSKAIVLGADIAKTLYREPLGAVITINNTPFTIIGVCRRIDHYLAGENPNNDIFMPFTTAKQYLCPSKKYSGRNINAIIASCLHEHSIDTLKNKIEMILRARHHLQANADNDFTIFDQFNALKAAQSSSNTINIFLFIIACLSLIVGGIGVMNSMLMSINERKQEIGIRMAIGASPSSIQYQFLIESLITCLIGGVSGIIVGIAASLCAATLLTWPIIIKTTSIIIAFALITLIGIVFGYYPAYKASQLDPVRILISE